MNNITSNQRKILTSAAQSIKPVVQIGQNGLSDAVIQKIDQSLEAHELIKVKFLEFKEDKQELSEKLCESCKAVLVRIIGNIAVLYRPAEKEDKRKYGITFSN